MVALLTHVLREAARWGIEAFIARAGLASSGVIHLAEEPRQVVCASVEFFEVDSLFTIHLYLWLYFFYENSFTSVSPTSHFMSTSSQVTYCAATGRY